MITLKELVKGTTAKFSHAIAGVLYYIVEVDDIKYQRFLKTYNF